MQAIVDAGQVVASLGSRILGRTAAEDIIDPATGEVIVPAGTLIEERDVEAIENGRRPGDQDPLGADLRDQDTASAASATGATSPAARRSTWAKRSASSRRSRSASRARSSPCAPSTSAARRRWSTSRSLEFELRGHGRDPQPQRRAATSDRRPDRHGPQHADRHRRRGRRRSARRNRVTYGARLLRRRGRHGQARPAPGRVGSLHPPDPHRSRRHGRLRGPRRGRLGDRRRPTNRPASPSAWSSTGAPIRAAAT